MSDEEAKAAYEAAKPVPLPPERIDEIVAYATGKSSRLCAQCGKPYRRTTTGTPYFFCSEECCADYFKENP